MSDPHRIRIGGTTGIVVCASLVGCSNDDPSSPEEAAETFMNALAEEDGETACTLRITADGETFDDLTEEEQQTCIEEFSTMHEAMLGVPAEGDTEGLLKIPDGEEAEVVEQDDGEAAVEVPFSVMDLPPQPWTVEMLEVGGMWYVRDLSPPNSAE